MVEMGGHPMVNMLSPQHHPLQALADLMTLREAFGDLENTATASASGTRPRTAATRRRRS